MFPFLFGTVGRRIFAGENRHGRGPIRMRLFRLPLVVLALWAALPAQAQDGRCYDGFPLGFTMPDSTVAYLEGLGASRFVQAFLLQLVRDQGDADHPLAIEARRFREAPADSAAIWYAMAPGADAVLCAVRTEAARRQRLLALGGKIGSALDDLTSAPGRPTERLASLGPGLLQLRDELRDDTTLPSVPALGRFLAQSDTARARLNALASAQAALDQAARVVTGVCPAVVPVDSLGTPAFSPACDTARADSSAAHDRYLRVEARFAAYRDTARAALDDLQAALSAAEAASVQSRAAIRTLALQTPGTVAAARRAAPSVAVTLPTATPLVQAAPPRPPDAVLWALTDFLIARAEEEVVTTYLSNARSWFNEPAVRAAFPDTRVLAQGLVADGYTVPLSAWRTVLASDFRAFPRRLLTDDSLGIALLGADRYAALAPDFRNVGVVVSLTETLADGIAPLTLFETLPQYADSLDLTPVWNARVQTAAQLAAGLARDYQLQGLRTYDTAGLGRQPGYVLSFAGLLGPDRERGHLYARLLLADVFRPDGPHPVDPAALGVASFDLPAVHLGLADALRTLETTLRQVETLDGTGQDAYALYLDTALEQVEVLIDLARVHGPADAEVTALLRRWDRVTTLYADLHQRAYADALTHGLLLFRDLADGAAVPSRFFQVAALAASVASARDGTQLQSAFRAAALPTGSRRAKREGRGGAIYLNAYLGGAAGAERVLGEDAGSGEPWAGALAVALPIGIEARLGRSPVSVFASLIDLGALASYRLRADSSSVASGFPKANLGQVIAPGLYLTLGWPGQPFALGAGVQLAPALRAIEADGTADERADVVRLGAFVAVDLPLLGF